jgi:hypothetical protein
MDSFFYQITLIYIQNTWIFPFSDVTQNNNNKIYLHFFVLIFLFCYFVKKWNLKFMLFWNGKKITYGRNIGNRDLQRAGRFVRATFLEANLFFSRINTTKILRPCVKKNPVKLIVCWWNKHLHCRSLILNIYSLQ